MRKKSWSTLIVWIVTFEAIGFFLGLVTQANIHSWYEGLTKSSLTPPGLVFSIVWAILYALLAFIGWFLSNHQQKPGFKSIYYLFCVQMLMNWAWTLLFFQGHWVGFSCLWLLLLTSLNLVILIKIRNRQRMIALLLIPYCLWLLFASYLNIVIWFLN